MREYCCTSLLLLSGSLHLNSTIPANITCRGLISDREQLGGKEDIQHDGEMDLLSVLYLVYRLQGHTVWIRKCIYPRQKVRQVKTKHRTRPHRRNTPNDLHMIEGGDRGQQNPPATAMRRTRDRNFILVAHLRAGFGQQEQYPFLPSGLRRSSQQQHVFRAIPNRENSFRVFPIVT